MAARRAYRNPELRISDVARDIDAPVHIVSSVVNRELGTNFSDLVNGYRVDEAAQLLLDPDRRYHTILSIGLEVGFASKASFNRAFKRHTGLTPSEYQRRATPGQNSPN